MAFRPILDRILVKRTEEEKKESDGGIAIPEAYRQQSNKGEVIAIGDYFALGGQVFNVDGFVQPGDMVLFGEYNAEKIDLDGEEFLLVRIQDIRGLERKEAPAQKDPGPVA